MKFNKSIYLPIIALFFSVACSDDDPTPSIDNPDTYVFQRDGQSTVSFGGQTTRIAMAEELASALKDETKSKEALLAMFAHEEGNEDFSDADLNASSKNIKSKSAASAFYATVNSSADAQAVKDQFETWIAAQHDEVFPSWEAQASAGVAGQLVDGESVRYVSANGVEYNQLVAKSLIGALMTDQMINNYLSTTVLDDGSNVENNDAELVEDGEVYTTMEHKWDEAYGYLYGASQDAADPNATLGDDSFLNKYLAKVDGNTNYTGIADAIYEALKLGRAAIVAKDYTVRDQQADIVKENISKVIAVRAIHYLQAGKSAFESQSYGGAFHDLSEGIGFVYSLQFTHNPSTDAPYFTKEEVDGFVDSILENENGLWSVSTTTLDEISNEISDAFGLELSQAAE